MGSWKRYHSDMKKSKQLKIEMTMQKKKHTHTIGLPCATGSKCFTIMSLIDNFHVIINKIYDSTTGIFNLKSGISGTEWDLFQLGVFVPAFTLQYP